ncbi:PREDICTED: homeobox-leucine zipper protein ROC5-like isoform X1 [Tarenaya hassleriana]|uniref:homeobox-leucine zipper protein ROC5-like isoform X1 n=1 Tax=Tarenaya hassleriana TaxID=28532 RepID=UPI00053C9E50|nr:PREDICTED: homeobox-leucine zipper protein ROC5-like isoform X1 [Tarenaya hassleriana]
MNRQIRLFLEQENAALRAENTTLRQTMLCPPCSSCNRPAVQPDVAMMEEQLRHENQMIRAEIKRMQRLTACHLSWSPNQVSTNHGDSSSSSSSSLAMTARWIDVLALATDSANEVTRLARAEEPAWSRDGDGGSETLNLEMYYTRFLPCEQINVEEFVHEASRATGLVAIDAPSLLRNFANPSRWVEIFPSMIASSSIEARNRILQVVKVEFMPVVSPLVSTREVKLLRCVKQMDRNTWVVADVSPCLRLHHPNPRPAFIRFPSGYVIQRLANDFSKVTVVEHWGYKEDAVVTRFRSYLRTGLGFGAHRWLAALQRSGFSSSTIRELSPLAKRNLVNLSRRMVSVFCAGVCGITGQNWKPVGTDRLLDHNIRVFSRETQDRGNPCVLLSASGLVRMQAKPDVIFGLLCDARNMDLWDHMRHSGEIEERVRVSKGPNPGNHVSIFRVRGNSSGANEKYVLQETYHEASATMVIHSAVDLEAAAIAATHGEEYSGCDLLPSGFTIMPGCQVGTAEAEAEAGSSRSGGDEWCVVTAGFQMVAGDAALTGGVSDEMVNAVEEMVSSALGKLRNALPVNLGLR